MQLKLSYQEIQRLIADKTGKELPMCYGGPHTLRVSHQVPLMGSVGLDINVDRIDGTDLFLSYGGGAGIEFMVRTALSHYKGRPEMEFLELLEGSCLRLMLGKNPQLAALFERIQLTDIHFDEQSVMIDFVPRP